MTLTTSLCVLFRFISTDFFSAGVATAMLSETTRAALRLITFSRFQGGWDCWVLARNVLDRDFGIDCQLQQVVANIDGCPLSCTAIVGYLIVLSLFKNLFCLCGVFPHVSASKTLPALVPSIRPESRFCVDPAMPTHGRIMRTMSTSFAIVFAGVAWRSATLT